MVPLTLRLVLALAVTGWGAALFLAAGNPAYAAPDPALKFYRIPLVPETLYAAQEAICLFLELMGITNSVTGDTGTAFFFLRHFATATYLSFGFAYLLFAKKNYAANGVSLRRPIPLTAMGVLTAVNFAVFFSQFPLPALAPAIRVITKILLAVQLLWAGFSAVSVRGLKERFYPSTMGGFWLAMFCLAYFPFPSMAEATALQIPGLDPFRPVSLQFHPFREFIGLSILTFHFWPVHAAIKKTPQGLSESLSAREKEVAELLERGLANAYIAEELHISVPTVKSHVRNVLRKNGAASRNELTRTAIRQEAGH